MKVLVIGKGGREHALAKALKLSPQVVEVHAIPGNPGFQREAVCHNLKTDDFEGISRLCQQHGIDLAVIGPEAELDAGLSDFLRSEGLHVFGPSQKAAQLESSKIFSKRFMVDAGIPTAKFVEVNSVTAVKDNLSQFTAPYVLKADGLAAGKGVFICKTEEELLQSAERLFEKKEFGSAGEKALLEQFQPGWELSFHVLTNGKSWQALPLTQDHKRLGEGDQGPNTGGMGVVGPLQIECELLKSIEAQVIEPTIKGIQNQGLLYRGVLYVGLMITEDGPQVLEYNVRFGDPETQVLMPLVEGDWGLILKAIAEGQMPEIQPRKLFSACVVLAAPGYPDQPEKGLVIEGQPFGETASSYFLHAGTSQDSEGWKTNGGRVLNAVAMGSNLKEALDNAYEQANLVQWSGMQMRTDIGHKLKDSQ